MADMAHYVVRDSPNTIDVNRMSDEAIFDEFFGKNDEPAAKRVKLESSLSPIPEGDGYEEEAVILEEGEILNEEDLEALDDEELEESDEEEEDEEDDFIARDDSCSETDDDSEDSDEESSEEEEGNPNNPTLQVGKKNQAAVAEEVLALGFPSVENKFVSVKKGKICGTINAITAELSRSFNFVNGRRKLAAPPNWLSKLLKDLQIPEKNTSVGTAPKSI